MKNARFFSKIMSVVLAMAMVVSMLPMSVFATQTEIDVGTMSDDEVVALCVELAQAGDTAAIETVAAQLEADEDETRYARVEAMLMAELGIEEDEGEAAPLASDPATVTAYKQVDTYTDKQVDLKYYEYVGTADDLEAAAALLKGAAGGLIEVSEGTLTVTDRQDMSMSNLVIKGAGKNATTITGDADKFNNKTNGLNSNSLSSEFKALLGLSAENIKVMDMTIDAGNCGVKVAWGFGQSKDFKTVRVNSGTAYLENLVISGKNARTTLMAGTSTGGATVYANNVTVNRPDSLSGVAIEKTDKSYLDTEGSFVEGIVLGSGADLGAGYYEVTYSGVTAYTTIPYAIEIYEKGMLTSGFVNAQTTAQGVTVAEAMTADLTSVIDGSTTLLYGKDCDEMKALADEFKTALAGVSDETGVVVTECLTALATALAIDSWHDVEADGTCATCGKTGLSVPAEKPSVDVEIPENIVVGGASGETVSAAVQAEIIDRVVNNNEAFKTGFTPTAEVEQLSVKATAMTVSNGVATKMTFDVTPMLNGVEADLSEAITFRLPVDANVAAATAAVFHEEELLGADYAIKGDANGKYVEVTSADFSLYTVDTAYEAVAAVVEVATLADLLAALAADNDLPIVVTAEIQIPAGETVVLDLNGKTVTSVYQTGSTTKHIYPINNYGTLTIQDTKGDGSISGRGIFVQDGSKLTVDGGAIYAIDSNGGSALYQYGGGIVINGGRVEQKAEGTYNFAINGLGGTVTVNGGWVGGNHGAIAAGGATVELNDGTFVCTGTDGVTDNVLYTYDSGSIVINGGTFIADNDGPAGGCCVYDANGGATINGGTFGNSSGGDVWGTTGTTIKGGTFEDLTETSHIAPGYELGEDGKVVEKAPAYVAEVNGVEFASVIEALNYAVENSASQVVLLTDSREVMPTDVELLLKADLKIVSATGEAVAAKFYNNGTSYDFIFNSADNSNSTLTIGENVTFQLEDRVIWAGYYGNDVDVVVEGTLAGYQYWHGADTTVNATGTLKTTGEALVMRRGATLTVDGGKVDANYFNILAGNIFAENAEIECGAFWIANTGSYAGEGNVSINIWESTLTSSGNLKAASTHDAGVYIDVYDSVVSFVDFDGYGACELDAKTTLSVNGESAVLTVKNMNSNGTVELYDGGAMKVTGTLTNGNELSLADTASLEAEKIAGAGTVIIDAADMTAGNIATITGDASDFTGIVEVINNDTLEAEVDENGNIVLVEAKADLEGEGTAEEPFIVADIDDLTFFRNAVNAGESYAGQYFKLAGDIDLAVAASAYSLRSVTPNWEPIGTKAAPFKGTFDGNGKTISNLIVVGEANQGLFGYADNATIKNVTIENAYVKGTDCVGAVAGQVYSVSLVDNCHVSGSIQIEGQTNVGGIVGKYYTKVTNSSVIGDGVDTSYVKGVYVASDLEGDNVGGIMGHCGENNNLTGNTVKNITVSGTRKVGGIVGIANQDTEVNGNVVENVVVETTATADYAASKVNSMSIGGLIGQYQQAGSTNDGTVTGNTVTGVTFNIPDGITCEAGVIVGGARGGSTGMLAPSVNVTAESNTVTNVTGATNKYLMPVVAKIGDVEYATLAEAAAAAQAGDEIVLLADATVDGQLTLPAGIILNGGGYQINGNIVAGGDLTFKGHTKVTNFNAGYSAPTITIGEGACLEMNGSSRMVIGHGATFNITGTIADAKTADKAVLTPSLIMPGASFTGAGVTFNVTNAYVKAPSSYCSSSSSASGTFDFNIENSIIETAGKLAFESQSTAATVNFDLKNSVLTTGSHLVFGVSRGEVVIDNSNVNVGTSRQIENQSTMTVKNGSVVNGAVATSSNAKNPGTLIIDNATYAVTGEFSGSDLGTGTLIVKKGASFTAGSITKADIVVDATGMASGDEINITANLSKHEGTLEVANNDGLTAEIVDGKIVLTEKTVAEVNGEKFTDLQAAIDASANGDTVTLLADIALSGIVSVPNGKGLTIDGAGHKITSAADFATNGNGAALVFADGAHDYSAVSYTLKDLTFEGFTGLTRVVRANFGDIKIENCKFNDNTVTGGVISSSFANLTVDACAFDGNTVSGFGVIDVGSDVSSGTQVVANITNSSFTNNDVAFSVLFLFSDANATGNYFSGNTHNGDAANAAAVLAGPYAGTEAYTIKVSENAFVDAMSKDGAALPAVFLEDHSNLGNAFDISANYWDGAEPALGAAYKTAGTVTGLTLDSYYAAYADGTLGDLTEIKAAVAEINGVEYADLQAAIDAAGEGDTVTLLDDVVLTNTIKVLEGKTVTLDLNGKTIDGTGNVRIALMSYGDLTLKDSSAEQTGVIKAGIGTAGNAVNICAGSFTMESGSIYSLNNAILIDEEDAVVNIKGGKITAEPGTNNSAVFYVSSTSATKITITGGEMVGYNGILLWNNTEVEMTGGSIEGQGTEGVGIQGNGSRDNTAIAISGGSVTGGEVGIYHPQGGTLSISDDAVISGGTGIVVKGGNVTITGGTINGTGAAGAYAPVGSGFKSTGDALYVEHYDNSTNSENYGTPVVTVTGGVFNSANGAAVASYANLNNAANGVAALEKFISGGTFNKTPAAELAADGFEFAANGDGTYGVGTLPEAEVKDLGKLTVDEYSVYNGSGLSDGGEPIDLTIAMEFVAKDGENTAGDNAFADYITDFYITMSGMSGDSFVANGCYLAGHYGDFGWVMIPLDGMTIENGKVYPVITSVGFEFTYEDICTSVKDFKCGIYVTPEVLAANPELTVNLTLALSEDVLTEEEAQNPDSFITVDEYDYDAEELKPVVYVAEVNGEKFTDLQAAENAANDGDTIVLLEDIELTKAVTFYNAAGARMVTLDMNGKTITLQNDYHVFYVCDGLTITGNGEIIAAPTEGYDWAHTFIVGHRKSGTTEGNAGNLIIENGYFYSNDATVVSVTNGSATILGGTFKSEGDLDLNCIDDMYDAGKASIVVKGGTFADFNPENNASEGVGTNFCADGFTCARNVDGTYSVGTLPEAEVKDLGKLTVDEYSVYNGSGLSDGGEPIDLTIAMEFVAKDGENTAGDNVFANYITDFYITMSGMSGDSFVADGCYLAGHYGDFGWVMIPLDGMTIENGKVYPVITSVGFEFTYEDICTSVKDFKCGIYVTPEVLAANPELTVNLTLALSEDVLTEEEAQNPDSFITVDEYDYDAEELKPVVYVAEVNGEKFTDLQAAIDAAGEGAAVTLLTDIELNEMIVNSKKITLDLNGKTVTGTDEATGSFGLITNRGTLTIKDSVGGGMITLTATNDRGWNAYSSVVSNNPGGKFTLESGTLEHLGGTSMAYGIDNLTNGKGTYAETVINGGTVKSTYRAIRQFLNGVEAQNILTVNGGTIEGANKSIWMQDPSTKANTGTLTVSENAVLKGDVYLYVCADSTEWPVEVSIAAAALDGESTVLTGNVPEGYELKLTDDVYGVVEVTYVAQIGEVKYNDLQAAIDAAGEGDTVTLLTDVELSEALTVAADKVIILELNGKTVAYTNTVQGEAMITNRGTLTIKDSVGTGVINYNYTGAADSSYGKGNYTISNGGTLTVNGGKITIANLRAHAKYPIDNNSTTGDAVLVINGGHLYNYNTSAIRQFCNSTTYQNSVTINGGLIEGYSAIWMQNPNDKTVNGQLTVTGGEIKTTAAAYVNGTSELEDVASRIYCTTEGGSWSADSKVILTGGTFNENVELAENAPANITADEQNALFNGRLELPVVYVAEVNGEKFTDLQAAIDAAGEEGTVTLLDDLTIASDLNNAAKGYFNITADQKVTIDLNGKTITVTDNSAGNFILFYNYGELTMKDSVGGAKVDLTSTIDREWNAQSTIILNRGGVLTVEGGEYNHLGGTDMAITVCNSGNSFGDAHLYVNGGTITSTYVGVRMRMADPTLNGNPGNGLVYMTVTGGTIKGENRGIWGQITNAATDDLGKLDITGGTIEGGTNAIRMTADESANIDITISGDAMVKGALVGDVGDYAVTGGTFTTDVTEFCADGFTCEQNADGTYGIVAEELFEITRTNMAMGQNLKLLFAFEQSCITDEDLSDYVAKVSVEYKDDRGTVETEIAAADWARTAISGVAYWAVTVSDLAAKEMDDKVTVTIYKGDEAVSKPKTTSLIEYGMDRLANSTDDLFKTTVVDMLNYGAEAQIYFEYNTENLANRKLTDEQKSLATTEVTLDKTMEIISGSAEHFVASNVRFQSDITMLFAVSRESAAVSAKITFKNHRGTEVSAMDETPTQTSVGGASAYAFEFTGMVVADIDQIITAEFFDAEGNVVLSLTDSLDAYLGRLKNTSSMYNLAIAFGKFSTSAYAFLHK